MSNVSVTTGGRNRTGGLRTGKNETRLATSTAGEQGVTDSADERGALRTLPREGDIDRVQVRAGGAERVDRRSTSNRLRLASEHLGLAQSAEHTLTQGARALARIDALAAEAIAGHISRDRVDEVRALALGLRDADRSDALRRARLLIEDRRGRPANVLPIDDANLSPEAREKLEQRRLEALPPIIELRVADVTDATVASTTRQSLGDAVVRTAELLTAVRKLGAEAAEASAELTTEFSAARPPPRHRRALRGRNAASHSARQLARITASHPKLALASQPFVSVESALRVLE